MIELNENENIFDKANSFELMKLNIHKGIEYPECRITRFDKYEVIFIKILK